MSTPAHAPAPWLGPVALSVSNLECSRAFYQETLGFTLLRYDHESALLGVDAPLILLIQQPGVQPRPRNTTGLSRVAILLPSRTDLACTLRHLRDGAYPLQRTLDHSVGEALYLADPDGNGIEIYRDRPRSAWPWQQGRLQATNKSEPLDVENLLLELDGSDQAWHGLPPRTRIGHLHFQVADLARAVAFYRDALGFQESLTGIPGACFLAAGGYHHHLGLNTEGSRQASPTPAGPARLHFFTICLPGEAEVASMAVRLEAAGIPLARRSELHILILRDPDGNSLLVMARRHQSKEEVMSLAKLFI
jgi:catechol 2,3-dioxygenase